MGFKLTIGQETRFLSIPRGREYDHTRVYIFSDQQDMEQNASKSLVYIDTDMNIIVGSKIGAAQLMKEFDFVADSYDYIKKLAVLVHEHADYIDKEMRNKQMLYLEGKLPDFSEQINQLQKWADERFGDKKIKTPEGD